MKTIKELELSLIVKEAMIQQLKLKNNQLEEKINKAIKRLYKVDFEPYQDEEGNYIVGLLTDKDIELLDILEDDEEDDEEDNGEDKE